MKSLLVRLKNNVSRREKCFILIYIFFVGIVISGFYITFYSTSMKSNDFVVEGVKDVVNRAQKNESILLNTTVAMHNASFSDFESVYKQRSSLESISSEIETLNGTLSNSTLSSTLPADAKALRELLAEYKGNIDSRLGALDNYLTEYKSFKASMAYLPVAKKELLAEMRASKVDKFDTYKSLVNQIFTDVQQFVQFPDSSQKALLFATLDRHQEKLSHITVPIIGLETFFSQSKVLADTRLSSIEKLETFSDRTTAQLYKSIHVLADKLFRTQWLMDKSKGVGAFFVLLAGFCVFTFTSLIWSFVYRGSDFITHSMLAENTLHKAKQAESDEKQSLTIANAKTNNEDLTSLATSFSHQLKTPIKHIGGNIETLRPILEDVHNALNDLDGHSELSRLPDSIAELVRSKTAAEFPFVIDEINDGISTANDIIDNIKTLAAKKTQKRINLDMNSLVRKAISMKQASLQSCANFKVSFDDAPAVFRGSSIDVINAISYVIDNALEAVEENSSALSSIEISTLTKNETIKVMIRDNGIGISKADGKRIYDPFFGTKSSTGKLGMGLTYAKQSIERHGGKIDIVPGIDSGTLVRISFPALKCSNFDQYVSDDSIVKSQSVESADESANSAGRVEVKSSSHLVVISDAESSAEASIPSNAAANAPVIKPMSPAEFANIGSGNPIKNLEADKDEKPSRLTVRKSEGAKISLFS